jgi:hypothetical protein
VPVAAKAFFTVTAGLIPGEPIPEHTRLWSYTSLDHELDRNDAERFLRMREQATAYANLLMNPAFVNWVRLDFLWV